MVEIGGSYRLPEVMQASGAILREVGTTNKTRIGDYQAAIGPQTAALLHVHPSNYVVQGFTESTSLTDLVALARREKQLVIDDIGSGALWDFARCAVTDEPRPQDSIKSGADVVLFSGDKLLGGPQCGIIVGSRACIDKISRHPLARAVRVDKLTLAALAATLRLYQDPDTVEHRVPLLMLLTTPVENLRNRAERLAPQLAACPAIAKAEPVADTAFLGGGSMPSQSIPTWCVALTPARESVEALSRELRHGHPSVCGRISQDRLLVDLRSVFARQDHLLVSAVRALGETSPSDQDSPDPAHP